MQDGKQLLPLMVQTIFNYLMQAVFLTLEQLLIVLGPMLVLAVILNYLSRIIRTRAADVVGVHAYTWLTAPGVMIHELGHAFFCILFGHRIVRMRLFSPQADGSLGSVEHAFNPKSTYQKIGNFFIGTGPIWFGTAVVCLLTWCLLSYSGGNAAIPVHTRFDGSTLATIVPQIGVTIWQLFLSLFRPAVISTWPFWLFAYLIFCIGSHITLSPPDIRGAAQGFISLVSFVFLFNLLTLWIDPKFTLRAGERIWQQSALFYAAIAFVICLNLGVAVAMVILSSVLHRR
jgi:hypothetical protein